MENNKCYLKNLNNAFSFFQSSLSHTCILANGGIKDGAATAIAYIWQANAISCKKQMHTTHISSTKTEIMSICIGLEQALESKSSNHITVITDSIQVAKRFFDTSAHSYQLLVLPLAERIHSFFSRSPDNRIEIWHCPNSLKWKPYLIVNENIKSSRIPSVLPSKESWEFSRKAECNDLLNYWKMSFYASDRKGKYFLEITNNNGFTLEPFYKKGGTWLSHFRFFNSTCARMTRLITNHAPIGEYYKRFFPHKEYTCPCSSRCIETRTYILHECTRYNEAWWLPDYSVFSLLMFLKENSEAFCFNVF